MVVNAVPEVGDQWQRMEDGRTFFIQRLTSQYASGVWFEDVREVVERHPTDEAKTMKKKVKIPECAGGVLARSFANPSLFRLVKRS